jgi:outer membrane protein assembly factor BamB
VQAETVGEADWGQWRGPNRDGVSAETGLLQQWPQEGPNEVWRVALGEGYSGISIVGGRIYTMSSQGADEFIVCLDALDGHEVWRFRVDSNFINDQGNGPRSTPTVDGDRVYVLSSKGKLYALERAGGKKLWRRDLRKSFGSHIPYFGFSTSPLIEDDLLLMEAGGPF